MTQRSLPNNLSKNYFTKIWNELNDDDLDSYGITVGKKPSAAGSYLDDTTDVLQLLNTLVRSTKRDKKKNFSAIDLPSQAGGPAHTALRENFNTLDERKVAAGVGTYGRTVQQIFTSPLKATSTQQQDSPNNGLKAGIRAMSAGHLPLNSPEEDSGMQRTLSSSRLTMMGYLESIHDEDGDDKEDGIFF